MIAGRWMGALVCMALLGGSGADAGEAVRIGTETRIFVDDALVAVKTGVVRKVHPCRKLPGPVVEPERPWEGRRVYVYGTVHYDAAARLFRMWYASYPPAGKRDNRLTRSPRALVLYATSTDGVRWSRPNLGLYEYAGSKDNNIVYDLDSPSVLVDAREPDPAKRYKMIGRGRRKGGGHGAWVAYSSDGVHWKDYPVNPVFKSSDTITFTRDPYRGDYLAFHKLGAKIRGYRRRVVWLATSRNMQTWSPSKLVMAPDEVDDAWVKQKGQRTEFYNMSAFAYAGQFLALVPTFRLTRTLKDPAPDQSSHDGPIHAQLVHSRDGRNWRRLDDRTPAIPNGPADFDAGCILGVTNTPVIRDEEIWIYYTAITTGHGGAMPEKRITIGRAAWRLDGFVSLDAGDEEGVVETVALRLTGNRLIVNADASKGYLTVEVLNQGGRLLPGYASRDCIPLRTDAVRYVVRWKDHDRLKTERPVRLRFRLRNAELYAFKIGGSGSSRGGE